MISADAQAAFERLCKGRTLMSDIDQANAIIDYYNQRLAFHSVAMGRSDAERFAAIDTQEAMTKAGWRLKP